MLRSWFLARSLWLFALALLLSQLSYSQDHAPEQGMLQSGAIEGPDSPSASVILPNRPPRLPDSNRDIYYRNKLEFSLETGWLPNNIPFVFDFLVGSKYTTWPLHYTLVPNIASVRWHVDNIWGRSVFRGNTDMTFSGSYTAIPRGAETRYFDDIAVACRTVIF